ncbi:MAG: SH3 domain-containing protein [Clostridia bacterium]|nr:SH3 domain-containing protein [Clostridia bacterium]
MKIKLCASFFLALALVLCATFASAETARVVTPGGKLNMRKADNEKSKIVTDVPNKALVEVEEVGDVWSKITYKKKTGYVKTSFLKMASQLVGKRVYADEGTLYLLTEPDASAAIAAPVGCQHPVTVISVEGDWAKVSCGETTGYVESSRFSYQLEQPNGKADWISEPAVVAADCVMRLRKDVSSDAVATLTPGQAVIVTVIDGDSCLVIAESGCGYAPIGSIRLNGTEDGTAATAAVTAAQTALKKNFKAFAKEKLYEQVETIEGIDGIGDPLYKCGFYNEKDQYVYAALVDQASGNVVFTASYASFAEPLSQSALLKEGDAEIEISADSLAVGEVLDITVRAWTNYQCQYSLTCNGRQMAGGTAGRHFTASFRPKEAGAYQLAVTVRDEGGQAATLTRDFTVSAQETVESGENVYSQKDGWWDAVAYRKSTMEHSGCAIFALSHALHRMGVTGENTLPQALCKTYALCLTPEGTNNERLITTAGKDFGFKTQRQLIDNEKEIKKLLQAGNLFSFSVARGHIAMISGLSEDGSMVRVVDSAPSATFDRIVNASLYYQMRSGSFRAALSLDDIPGSRWFIDTEDYGGLEYWLPLSYAAKRGVRLIQPQ